MYRFKYKLIDVICFIGGTSIFVFTLFDFHVGKSSIGKNLGTTYYYYYTHLQCLLLAIGASSVVLGFLIRSWRK